MNIFFLSKGKAVNELFGCEPIKDVTTGSFLTQTIETLKTTTEYSKTITESETETELETTAEPVVPSNTKTGSLWIIIAVVVLIIPIIIIIIGGLIIIFCKKKSSNSLTSAASYPTIVSEKSQSKRNQR
jgi:hypothetical protein